MAALWVALEVVVIGGARSGFFLFGLPLWIAAHLAFLIFFAGLEAGMLRIGLAIHDDPSGRGPVYADVFKHLALGPRLLAGQLLYLLTVAIGLALLLAPGVYVAVRCAFFAFALADGRPPIVDRLRETCNLTRETGIFFDVLKLLAALFVMNLLGACVLGLGLLVTVPVSVLMLSAAYRQLAARLS